MHPDLISYPEFFERGDPSKGEGVKSPQTAKKGDFSTFSVQKAIRKNIENLENLVKFVNKNASVWLFWCSLLMKMNDFSNCGEVF